MEANPVGRLERRVGGPGSRELVWNYGAGERGGRGRLLCDAMNHVRSNQP